MPEAIKNIYNCQFLRKVALDIQEVYAPFEVDEFVKTTVDDSWDDLELKDRIYRIAIILGKYLPADYGEAIAVIDKVVMAYGTWLDSYCAFFPIFIELFGQDEKDWAISMAALARYTPYASSELAVRPFIINHEERMMAQMALWATHENECVRRLASEGCRPALPWAPAIVSFKTDPGPILPILTQLKTDPSLHVRKSVANNLNDISKTHPDLVIALAKDWYGKHEHTNWIVKHGCRTLLKKGNPEVLAIFGYRDDASIDVRGFVLYEPSICVGEALAFSFTIAVKEATKVRLEYGIDYVKANGKRNRKIFQISEILLKANQEKTYTKTHSFANLSTRRHYPGTHAITLIVNGTQRGTLNFELTI